MILPLLSGMLLTACAQDADRVPQELLSDVCTDCGFDTFFSLQQFQLSPEEFQTVFQEASGYFRHCSDLFDIYHNYQGMNNLKTVNDMAGIAPVDVEPEIIELLKEAEEMYELSDGGMDITMGSLFGVWHEYRTAAADGPGAVPSMNEVQTAAAQRGWEYIVIDEEAGTVYITDPGIQLDAGAIAKGWAVEKTALLLQSHGILTGAVNGGGNVRTLGAKPNGKPWRTGIQDPAGNGALINVVCLDEESVATSGDYERFFIGEDGQRYHHIIDPDTGLPAQYWHSVSIVTQRSDLADALSTALFTMSLEEGNTVLQKMRDKYPDMEFEAVWIADSDAVYDTPYQKLTHSELVIYTEGLEERIEW